MKSTNVSGQAYALTVMTPIEGAREAELRAYLESFRDEGRPSPFSKLPRTHFARFVIVHDYYSEPEQQHQDHLATPQLVFTSNFDGDRDSYLDEFCALPEAREIWGRSGVELKRYLLENQIDTGFFVAAYGKHTVPEVKAALAQREQLTQFAVASQGQPPDDLQAAFKDAFP